MTKKQKAAKSRGAASRPDQVTVQAADVQHVANNSLPLIWVDRMMLTLRQDPEVATLRFYSAMLDARQPLLVEACRIQMSAAHAREIVNVLCRSIDYYPEKPAR